MLSIIFHSTLALTAYALLIESVVSYPALVYRLLGHPVTWMGALLNVLERFLNDQDMPFAGRRLAGVMALALLLLATLLACALFLFALPAGIIGFLLSGLAASSLIAQRSLDQHVLEVALGLERGGLDAGRRAVGMIVGRNVAVLDEAGVARAAIESLAENFADGIVAPMFWMAMAGLPGAALYKAINTADSMIGHRTARYEAFGWAAARLDDLVNLPASRLAALFLVVAAALAPRATPIAAIRAIWRDAGRHRSPNAGWPEAAMAGALGLQLAGPRVYGDALVEDALMGDGRREARVGDIHRALRLYRVACLVQFAGLIGATLWFTWPA